MEIKISCDCGVLQGTILEAQELRGKRFICMCDDCQIYAHFLSSSDAVLDANGGTEVVPVNPARLRLTSGAEKLRCLRLTEKGLFRWYAGCCQTPVANSLSGKMGYIGLLTKNIEVDDLEQSFGPIAGRVMAKWGIPPLPADAHPSAPIGFVATTIGAILKMFLRGLKTPSPFFDSNTGQPVATPAIVDADERARLRARVHQAAGKSV